MTTTEPQKYARSLHAPISLGTTSDDRFMPRGFLSYFAELPKLVLTEKLDGQNNCFAAHGLYARSHAAPTQHPWDKPLLQRWQQIKDDLGDLELFGENMYAFIRLPIHNWKAIFTCLQSDVADIGFHGKRLNFMRSCLIFRLCQKSPLSSRLQISLKNTPMKILL